MSTPTKDDEAEYDSEEAYFRRQYEADKRLKENAYPCDGCREPILGEMFKVRKNGGPHILCKDCYEGMFDRD